MRRTPTSQAALSLLLAVCLGASPPISAAVSIRLTAPVPAAPLGMAGVAGAVPVLTPTLAAPTLSAPAVSLRVPQAALPHAVAAAALPAAVAATAEGPVAAEAPAAFAAAAGLAAPRGETKAPLVFDGARQPSTQENAVAAPTPGVRDDSWDLAPAARSRPSVVAIGPRNFELEEKRPDSGDMLDEMRAIKDPDARHFHILTTRPIDPLEAEAALRVAFPELKREQAQAQVQRMPALLKAHFAAVLARHPHKTGERAGAAVHTVEDGLAFWADFASPKDPEARAAAAVFMQSSARRIFDKDLSYSLVRSLCSELSAVSRVVDAAALSKEDRDALTRLAEERGLKTSRSGRWLLVGSGAGFHLMRSVLADAASLKEPAQQAKLDKVLGFLARRGIDIDQDQHLAAAAFYHPLDRRLAFVMPSRADLNTFSHEGTHARFHAFEDGLDRWLAKRGWALPYEDDGPAVALIGHGGYFSLLNELNSWRLGESFDKEGKDDAGIIAVLRDSYGRQAGAEAAAEFGRLWSEARVKGVSVPRLIVESVRALNRLDEAGADDLGRRALEAGEPGPQRDFLRLAAARSRKGATIDGERRRLVAALAARGADEGVRSAAEGLLRPAGTEPAPGSRSAARKARRAYGEAAAEWVKGLAAEGAIIPFDLGFGAEKVFRFAHERGLSDYDAVIAGLQERFGAEEVSPSRSERALFEAVAARPEAGLEAKLRGYLADFNARGFEALWAEYAKTPDYDLRELLVEKHKAEFTAAHAAQLVRWALAGDTPEALKTGAASLLEGLMSATGLDTIYPSHQLDSLRAMQRSMNASRGADPDAFMPANRPRGPAHPLLGPEVDRALAQGMFDGNPGIHRLKVIELVTQRTYPEELPALRRRVVEVITDAKAARFDQWVARMFMVPADSVLYQAHARWGASVARAVLGGERPNATALEFVGEHLRQGLGPALKGPSWGRTLGRLDAKARAEALAAVAGYSAEDADVYREALDDLWRLMNHPDPKVAKSARYAVAERPVFFIGLEGRLAAAPRTPGLGELLAMTEPGFVPALEAPGAVARAPLAPPAAFKPAVPAPAPPPAGPGLGGLLAAARAALLGFFLR